MADVTIRTEHSLAWRDRLLLERLVRGLERYMIAVAPTEERAALSEAIDKMAQQAEAVAKAQADQQAP